MGQNKSARLYCIISPLVSKRPRLWGQLSLDILCCDERTKSHTSPIGRRRPWSAQDTPSDVTELVAIPGPVMNLAASNWDVLHMRVSSSQNMAIIC
eukprot:2020953-Amphidinium_carterae.1